MFIICQKLLGEIVNLIAALKNQCGQLELATGFQFPWQALLCEGVWAQCLTSNALLQVAHVEKVI